MDEAARAQNLLAAQAKAVVLFDAITDRGLIEPGRRESEVSDAVRDLAGELIGVHRFWHKRIVRAGANTLLPYQENPPDRVIEPDDIVFADFGPLLEEWEADFGRTFVLGADPVKHRLNADLERLFALGRSHFEASPDITGEELFGFVKKQAEEAGWEFGNSHAGHLVGEFPHELIDDDKIASYIAEGSTGPMRSLDAAGRQAHWILEIHLVDRAHGFGGFYEELLDL